jgi:Domain of unknown function (DUF4410)
MREHGRPLLERREAGHRARRRTLGAMVALGIALGGLHGCARTSVEQVPVQTTGLPKPQLIVVHDFAVSATDVALDRGLVARFRQAVSLTPQEEQRLKVEQEVSRVLTTHLVKELGSLGIPVQPASGAPPIAGPTLSIEGQILSIDEGNRTQRMVIGFGAGASEVRSLVQVYETTPEGRRIVEDFYATVKSSRKPGMGPMTGVGAATGRAATSAAVGGGTTLLTERQQTVEGDAANMAKEIRKTLEQFFVRQGWIAPR